MHWRHFCSLPLALPLPAPKAVYRPSEVLVGHLRESCCPRTSQPEYLGRDTTTRDSLYLPSTSPRIQKPKKKKKGDGARELETSYTKYLIFCFYKLWAVYMFNLLVHKHLKSSCRSWVQANRSPLGLTAINLAQQNVLFPYPVEKSWHLAHHLWMNGRC